MHKIKMKDIPSSPFIVNNKLGRFFIYLLLSIGVIGVFAPLFIILNVSLKSNDEYMMKGVYSIPENLFNVQNYIRAFNEGNFVTGFINTGILVVISVPLAILFGTMVAYILSRYDFKCKMIVYMAFLVPTFIPGMTVTIATFQIIKALGLYNSLLAGIILYIGTDIMQIYIFIQFINQIPKALDESARIDGASRIQIYYKIILPQLKPAIATTVILKMLGIYNDFFTPYMYMPKVKTAATGLYSFSGDKLAEWPLMSAAIILVAVPTIIIYVFLQKYIISGVTDGAVK
ncbi:MULTISPECIES: carbohydrate ABC transporter permease [unclassified Butyrivibrio]|uniref:carbohydrate ABC transporter permease n=1 Tax=unclassified Butyrivibrio TaxID=2639466 RepID=UPI0003F71898|nr:MULTISPECIES: carbohydrate ABC transporter permease [unclassified Butyrivibrio]SDB62076.1 multiple sugar transport system permease protein [Butyrivibrio sp. INlla16]